MDEYLVVYPDDSTSLESYLCEKQKLFSTNKIHIHNYQLESKKLGNACLGCRAIGFNFFGIGNKPKVSGKKV